MSMIELVLLKETIDVKLSKLECSLIHALFLHVVYLGCVRHLHQFLLDLLDWERSKLFNSDYQSLVILLRLTLKLLLNVKEYLS